MADIALRPAVDPSLDNNPPSGAKFEWTSVAQALVSACADSGCRTLCVASEQRSGRVFVEGQHVVHAEYGDETGLIALIEMLRAGQVQIRSWDCAVPLRRTLRIGAEALLTVSRTRSRPPPLPESESLRPRAQHREVRCAPEPPTGARAVVLNGPRHSGVFPKVPAPRFTGPLPELSLADLLQIVQWMGRSAVINITHAGVDTHIWCESGEIIDAQSGRLHAEAAMYRALTFETGWLIGELRPVQRPRTIFAATQRILLEAARRKDVSQHLRQALGDEHLPYRFAGKRIPPGLRREEIELLQSFTSGRTPYAAMQISELGDFETLKLLARWVQKGDLVSISRSARSGK
jgi:hypothetical protein